MPYPFTPEQMALLAVAQTSWRRRASAKRHSLSFDEEAITQTILMDLADHYPGNIVIVPFNHHQEGKTGADWAWAFQSADGSHVVPMLVQAKVLDLRDTDYPEIKRLIGQTTTRQIDKLIEFAKRLGWPAIYAFYNHLNDPTRLPDHCGTLKLAGLNLMPETWGISLADAYNVRDVLNDQSFDTHRAHSHPLHCLLCSGGTGKKPIEGSPGLAIQSLKQWAQDATSMKAGHVDRHEILNEPMRELPDLFREALRLTYLENEDERVSERRALAERYPNVAGAVILTDFNDG